MSGIVPIEWKCHILGSVVKTSEDAVFNGRHGWICSCGAWMRNSDNKHTVIRRGERLVFMEGKTT